MSRRITEFRGDDWHGLRTVVGRRIVLLFLLCAVLPTLGASVVIYQRATHQLETESRERLIAGAKWVGMAVMQQLTFLEQELVFLDDAVRGDSASLAELDSRLDGISDIAVVQPDGATRVVRGRRFDIPAEAETRAAAAAGVTALAIESDPDGARILLGRRLAPDGGVLWARMEADAPFRTAKVYAEEEPFDGFCVGSGQATLYCSPAVSGRPQELAGHGRMLEWEDGAGESHLGAVWPLFLGARFGAPSWTVLVSAPRASTLGSLAGSTSLFVLVLAAALSLVLLVSSHQMRRTLGPLERLKEAVDRIRQGEFELDVDIEGNDEFAALGAALTATSRKVGAQLKILETLQSVDRAVLSSLSEDAVVQALLTDDAVAADATAVGVALFDGHGDGRVWTTLSEDGSPAAMPGGRPLVDRLLKGREWAVLEADALAGSPLDLRCGEGADPPVRLVRLTTGAGMIGALAFAIDGQGTSRLALDEGISTIADQTAVALTAARLVSELDDLGSGAMLALARAIDAKSPWTAGHSERVAGIATSIAEEMSLEPARVDVLRRAALLHDIGKIAVPSSVLDKHGPLTPADRRLMEGHVEAGLRILEPIDAFADILPTIRDHHERLDGSGYPEGRCEAEIEPLAMILAVADMFDALTSERPYKPGADAMDVLRLLEGEAGTKLDVDVVAAFGRVISFALVSDPKRSGRDDVVTSDEFIT